MNPFEAISNAQKTLLRSSAWQILFIAVFQAAISVAQDLSISWLYLSVLLALISIPPLVSEGHSRWPAYWFILPLTIFSLIAPWELGGVRHPIALLPIVLMQTGAFMLGVPVAIAMGVISLANLLLLGICETKGIIPSYGPSPESLLLFVSVLTVHGLLFFSIPLKVVRQLLTQAGSDLSARRKNESTLIHMTDELESRVGARKQELAQSRSKLNESVDQVSASMGSTISDLAQTARELAQSFPADSSELAWSAHRIASGCDRMETMHASLHRFCKLGESALDLKPLAAQDHALIVHRIWNEVRSLQPERTISFFLDSLPGCTCDADLLCQVWQNLLTNAAKYTSHSPAPRVRIYFQDGEFCVEDNGVGFDNSMADRLFGVFQRSHTHREYAGTGIGLAMVRRIVELHGGTIRAEGLVGKGATFRFRLPHEAEHLTDD